MYVANINKIFDSYMKQCENVSKLLFTEKHILSSYSVLTMLDTFVQLAGHVCPKSHVLYTSSTYSSCKL